MKSRALPFLGSVWGAVAGRRRTVSKRERVEAAPAAPPISSPPNGEAPPIRTGNSTLAFLWKAKAPILFLAIFVLVVSLWRGWDPLDWITTSKDELRAELKDARADTDVARFETKLANRATELADDTNRDRSRRERVIAEAEQEIEDAVSQADFDRLYLAYRRAYDGVWRPSGSSDGADPGESGPAPVRRSGGFSA
ncbi:MAG: hypothetical protein BroJett013_07460 [Alphaproteobacteria bacterium]|nr:MAG: hypothetical protein BroJett013_07460 [Alphaproteobacteria bacterium]